MLPSLCAHLQGYFANDLSKVINRSINRTKQNRSRFKFRNIFLFCYFYFLIKLPFSVSYFLSFHESFQFDIYTLFSLLSITIRNIMIFYRLSLFECFFICCFSYILSLCTGWEIYALLITSLCIIKPLKSWDVKRMHCNTVTGRFRFRMNYNRNSGLYWHIIRFEHVNIYPSLSVYKRDYNTGAIVILISYLCVSIPCILLFCLYYSKFFSKTAYQFCFTSSSVTFLISVFVHISLNTY